MGCFNVSCGVSGVSIGGGDPAYLIPLVARKKFIPMIGSFICSNYGIYEYFVPLAFPIFGEYNDYGTLEDIRMDENVKCIEKYYGPINNFLERLHTFPEEPITILTDKDVGGMFVHGDIYQDLTTYLYDEYKGESAFFLWETGDLKPSVLKLFKFEFVKKDPSKTRYNVLFKSSIWPDIDLWSDGTWIRIDRCGKEVGGAYSLKDLAKFLGGETGIPLPNEIELECKSLSRFFPEFEDIKRIGLNPPDPDKDPLLYLEYLSNDMIMQAGSMGILSFMQLYKDNIEDVRQMFYDYMTFSYNMMGCNRILMPSYNCYQSGSYHGPLRMYQKAEEIVRNKLAERAEW